MNLYPTAPRKRIDLSLRTLLNEPVIVKLETVDYHHTLLSMHIGTIYSETAPGAAVAMRNEELKKIRNAIDNILFREPDDSGAAEYA